MSGDMYFLSLYINGIYGIALIMVHYIFDANLFFLAESDGTSFELFKGNGYALSLIGVYIAVSLSMSIWYLSVSIFHHKNNNVKKTKS